MTLQLLVYAPTIGYPNVQDAVAIETLTQFPQRGQGIGQVFEHLIYIDKIEFADIGIEINKHGLFDVDAGKLLEALEKSGGNQSQAAKIIGVSRVTVWNRMKRYNLQAKRKILLEE